MRFLLRRRRTTPSRLPDDATFRRLRYCRYADDFLLGFIGPKAEAEEIKRQLGRFLCDHLKLDLSETKTVITHARTQAARFLGYDIVCQHADDKLNVTQQRTLGAVKHRTVNGSIGLRVPAEVAESRCRMYMRGGEPRERTNLTTDSDFAIVAKYQSEYRGLVQYYLLANNVWRFHKLHYVTEMSLLKTLAAKHKTSVGKQVRKYRATIQTPYGPHSCLQVFVPRKNGKPPLQAVFGGIPLRRQPQAQLHDRLYRRGQMTRNDLLQRFLADTCELCGHQGHCVVHHVRRLADLRRPGQRDLPEWMKRMLARRRKTLVVCVPCHTAIHAGQPFRQPCS